MKKKILVEILMFLIAVALIAVIAGVKFVKPMMEKYSYSKEQADLDAYFHVKGDEYAIILQDERIEEKAVVKNGMCYFDLDTVHKYLNEIFYVDREEKLLLYTDAEKTTFTGLGDSVYYAEESHDAGYALSFEEGGKIYIAADYVKLFTNYAYEVFARHVQLHTEWGDMNIAQIRKATAVREKGGIKSPILREMEQDERVKILEEMDTWSKIKTSDSLIGYVENKFLHNYELESETPVRDYVAPAYTGQPLETKVSLGFHSIGGVGGNSTLKEMVTGTKGMNVIAPTWFSLTDEEGTFRSFGEADYVKKAHDMGLQVWGVFDNFNYRNENQVEVDEYQVLSSTDKRQKMVYQLVETAAELGLDGINIDFEQVASETGEHFVQFLRELSVACRKKEMTLSVDNYVPFHFNEHYRLDIQGQIADYVLIMGYDEHWHGCGEPGSVASIEYVSNGIAKTVSQVPAEKVINALPLYTIVWTTDGTEVTDEYLTLNNVKDFLSQVKEEPSWDEETCQNYLEWQSSSGLKQVWLEDVDSIRAKLNVMSSNNVGGVAVWRLGYGTSAVWELLNVYINS